MKKFTLRRLYCKQLAGIALGLALLGGGVYCEAQPALVQLAQQDVISQDEARAIAAQAIGVSENELFFKKVKLDYDDDYGYRPIYEIECLYGYTEYELDIDATTGDVLSCHIDD